MQTRLEAVVRAHRAEIEEAWAAYVLGIGDTALLSPSPEERRRRVAAGVAAFLALIEEGRDRELREVIAELGRAPIEHGVSLRDLHRVMLGFREVLLPMLLPEFGNSHDLLGALSHVHRCTDRAVDLLTDAYCHSVLSEIRALGSLLREEEGEIRHLRQASESKTEFVSMVSHELRSPLTAILGFAKLLLRDQAGALSPVQREFLETIDRNANRLLHLVNDLLDISRIEAGRLQLRIQPFDLATVVESVVQALNTAAETRRITLRTEVPQGLNSLLGDEERIAQVLSNLVSNAIKYGPENAPVEIHVQRGDGEVTLQVADRGAGISPQDQERLFRKFSRLDNEVTRQTKGTGLGLAIARHLVEMHGGRIWVENRAGGGTLFCFSLPAGQ